MKGKNKRKPFFRAVKKIIRFFSIKPKIINYGDTLEMAEKSIIVSNHSGAVGPLNLELWLDHYFVPWGTHEMNGNLKSRWNFLTNIYFTKKKGLSKFVAVLISIPAVFVLKWFYRGIELISSYNDSRLKQTFDKSIKCLDNNQSILIFPENSDSWHKEEVEKFHAGFVSLSKIYYNKRKEDLPVYPVNVYKKKRVILIGEPQYVQPLVEKGLTKEQIAEHFMRVVNGLRDRFLLQLQSNKNK